MTNAEQDALSIITKDGRLEFREVPVPLSERVKIAELNKNLNPSLYPNCHGTTFFLFGVLPYDVGIDTSYKNELVREIILRMIEIKKLENNSLIMAFSDTYFDYLIHSAFIESISPFIGYQREGVEGTFRKMFSLFPFIEYIKHITYSNDEVKYRYFKLNPKDNLSDWAMKIVGEYSVFNFD